MKTCRSKNVVPIKRIKYKVDNLELIINANTNMWLTKNDDCTYTIGKLSGGGTSFEIYITDNQKEFITENFREVDWNNKRHLINLS